MDYSFSKKYEKLRKRLNVSKIYIAQVIEIRQVEYCEVKSFFDIGRTHYYYNTLLRAVYMKNSFDGIKFIDLETGIVYCDKNEMIIPKESERYIMSNLVIPFSKFVSEKYKYRTLKIAELLELTDYIIEKISKENDTNLLNDLEYDKLFVTSIYNSDGNVKKDKAVVYQLNNEYIDVESKEKYLTDENILNKKMKGNFIKLNQLTSIKDFLNNKELPQNKKIKEKK